MHLEVEDGNAPALALYRRLGFGEIGRREGYYGRADGSRAAALTMRLHLEPPVAPGIGLPYKQPQGAGRQGADRTWRYEHESGQTEAARRHRARVQGAWPADDGPAPDYRPHSRLAHDHPDVVELHKRASAVDDRISLSTVYRTVKLFQTQGIIERLEFRDGRSRYEQAAREHHDHLINLETGDVIEFQSDEIEALQVEIARRLGYKVIYHRLELYVVPNDEGDA